MEILHAGPLPSRCPSRINKSSRLLLIPLTIQLAISPSQTASSTHSNSSRTIHPRALFRDSQSHSVSNTTQARMHSSQQVLAVSHSAASCLHTSSSSAPAAPLSHHTSTTESSSCVNYSGGAPQCCHCGWRGAHAPTCPFK